MAHCFKMLTLTMILSLSIACVTAFRADNTEIKDQITAPEKAAEHAAKLANEKCQKEFGNSPFSPESYKAELIGAKWHWGEIEPKGINGYSAKVEFNKDGSDEDVKVVLSVDTNLDQKPGVPKTDAPVRIRDGTLIKR